MRTFQRWVWAASVALGCGCGGGLASLPAGAKPAWVSTVPSTEYPDTQFLTGIGMTPLKRDDLPGTQAAADAAARVELSKKIEVSVSSEFTSFQAEHQVNGSTQSQQSVSELTQEAVKDMELEGVEVRARWRDDVGEAAYALAVWPKAKAEALLKAKMSEAEQLAKRNEADGDSQASGNPAGALKQYLAARGALEKTANSAMLLRAVTGHAAPVPDIAPIRGKLAKLLDEVDVKVDSGDKQRVKPDAAAPQPLVVRATLRGVPLAGLPISFVMAGGSLDGTAVTDAQGLAAARVTKVGNMASGEAQATAQVDWVGLSGVHPAPAWGKTLRPVSLAFRMVPSGLTSTRVLVKIIERIEETPTANLASVQSAVSTSFTHAGFGVADAEALLARVPQTQLLTLDPKSFQKEARDLADLVVVGEAVSSYSSTLSGDVVVHRARMTLRAVDLGTGEVVATFTLEKKGAPAKGPEKAGRKALDALAAAMTPEFCDSVKHKLGF